MERSIVADSELVPGGAKRNRRWHSVEEKRRIVEETLVSGASVSQVARLNGVNANQMFPVEAEVSGRRSVDARRRYADVASSDGVRFIRGSAEQRTV